jgi:hypothetical protein
MTHRRLTLIWVLTLCSSILVLGYAWQRYQLIEREHQVLAETSARLQEVLLSDQGLTESVMGTSDGMTYDEFFRTCDKAIDKRNELVTTVRSLPLNVLAPLRGRIISYIKDMNELVRAKARLMRLLSRWEFKTRTSSADFARFEAEYSGLGGPRAAVEYAYRRSVAEVKALAEEMRESSDEFDALYAKLATEEDGVSEESRRVGITFEPGLRKLASANSALSANARSRAAK